MLYALGVFFEYNAPPGPINQCAGRAEFVAILFLVHLLYGFTFTYFNVKATRYHRIAIPVHAIVLALICVSDLIVADRFVSRDFTGLAMPSLCKHLLYY